MLRINTDGTIPTDNPFFSTATGKNRAIWALGLRNPFTFAFNAGRDGLFINDVGQNTWEEINDGIAGANYGWPTTEGADDRSAVREPALRLRPSSGGGCAITGGAFYAPATLQFPSDYVGDYFFADYCGGWIRKLDPANGNGRRHSPPAFRRPSISRSPTTAASTTSRAAPGARPVRRTGSATARAPPSITSHPASRTVAPGASVDVQRAGVRRATAAISMAAQQRQHLRSDRAGLHDRVGRRGGQRRALPRRRQQRFRQRDQQRGGADGLGQPGADGTITQPAAGTLYSGGRSINYAGTGTDPEDGTLAGQRIHVAGRLPSRHALASVHRTDAAGATQRLVHDSDDRRDVGERLVSHLPDRARFRGGLTHTTQRDILPRKVAADTGDAIPAGLQVRLDGQPSTTPFTFDAVVGIAAVLRR